MFRRFLLLLLIALLPLQGVAASFMVKCPEMTSEQMLQSAAAPHHEMAQADSDMPCHQHEDDGSPPDQGCCHHLAVAIPQLFSVPASVLDRGQAYPAIAATFTDHLPDRLQRPPPNIAI